MRIILVCLFLLVLGNRGHLIDFPKAPKMPKFPSPPAATAPKEDKSDKAITYKVSITTYKGSRLEGKLSLKGEGITIKNKKDGFVFYKKLSYKDIKSIEMMKWGEAVIDSKYNTKDSKLYAFYPIEFKIVEKSGEAFSFYGRIRELEKFKLSNDLGVAIVYSVFYDYWTGEVWKNSKSKKFEYNRKIPNEACLKKVVFTG